MGMDDKLIVELFLAIVIVIIQFLLRSEIKKLEGEIDVLKCMLEKYIKKLEKLEDKLVYKKGGDNDD